jgi:hypothetical protein
LSTYRNHQEALLRRALISPGSDLQNYEIEKKKLGFPHKTLVQGFIDLEGFIEEEVAVLVATPLAAPIAVLVIVPMVQ